MKALITSASRKLPLLRAIQTQLDSVAGAALVLAADSDPRALAAYAWPDFWQMPRLDGPADLVLEAVAAQGADLVIPTRDADVEFFARHQDVLAERGVRCLVPPIEAVELCADKVAFSERLLGAGLPAIPTSLDPSDPALGPGTRVVKERRGAGALGMALNVDHANAVVAAAALDAPCFQPFVAGPELSLDAYRSSDGRLLGVIARTRDVVIAGESAVTMTIDATPYLGLVGDVLTTLGLTGHALIQVILSAEGPVIVECNARLGGASTLSLAAGLSTIAWFAMEAGGADPSLLPFIPHDGPLQLVRVPQDVIRDPRL